MTPAYVDAADVLARMREAEKTRDLFSFRVGNWSAWQTLRFRVFLELSNLPFASTSRPSRWGRLASFARAWLKDGMRFVRPPRATVLVKTFSSARRLILDGKALDIYFDELLDTPAPAFRIETVNRPPSSGGEEFPAYRTADVNAVLFDTTAALLARCWVPREVRDVARRLAKALEAGLGPTSFSEKRVARILAAFHWEKRLYARLLAKVAPRCVLVADTGEWALMAAAKERGVVFAEFQHGLLHPLHATVLPGELRGMKSHLLIPDKYLLYGDYWVDRLRAFGPYDAEPVAVGNVHLDRYRALRRARPARCGGAPVEIVVTTQALDQEGLIRFFKEFLEKARARLNVRLVIKTHPGHENNGADYENAFRGDARVTVVPGMASPNTFELLARADAHVSVSSSCHYDAIGLGTPTIILGLATHDLVRHLHEEGRAALVFTPEEMVRVVESGEAQPLPESVGALFFKPGALGNARRALGLDSEAAAPDAGKR
jgi:hypothetical protein